MRDDGLFDGDADGVAPSDSSGSAQPGGAEDDGAKASANPERQIAKAGESCLSRAKRTWTVGALEQALLREFPREDAESWDVMGMTVGERGLAVQKVALALDPTVAAIRSAAEAGANVLITHHPPYLEAPKEFSPADSVAQSPGAGVWAAIRNRVALMNFHTALDVSHRAQAALPNLLGFARTGKLLCLTSAANGKGYGPICEVPLVDGSADTLGRVAAKCVSVFGRTSQVWGDFSKPVRTCAIVGGSASSMASSALGAGVDCLICGEVGYHRALDLSSAGIGIIELGHDVSELPLVAVLARTLADIGLSVGDMVMIDQSENWTVPDPIRI